MAALDGRRWRRASPQLDLVLDLAPADRDARLASLRAEDPELAADVQALLDEHRRLSAERFLEERAAALPLPPLHSGATLGAYTVTEPLGHGGMGSVWLASRSDGRFEGKAAVKLLNADLVGRAIGERFKREGTILARLTHPHIARLIDAGVSQAGQPYLVLEYVAGRHIDAYCAEHALGIDERLRLFLDVLSAVAHAHASLIVHRDLKPSNVLVTNDGQVKLLDFGIAKLIEDDERARLEPTLTREAGAGLTPRYAAPEQLSGGAITTATDVYALGLILYELLAGQHPLGSETLSTAEIVKAVVETEVRRMSSVVSDPRARRTLQGDLDTVVAKALKKRPEERYASVAEFADDLRRYANNQPISARPDTFRYRAGKFVRRHRRILLAGTAAASVVCGLIGYYTVRLASERDRAELQARKASRVSELMTRLLTGADPYRDPDAKEPTVRNLLDIGAERAASELGDQPELQAEMFTVIGRTYERLGLNAKALPLLEQALAIGRRTFGTDDARVGQSLNDLGVLQRSMGNLAAAEPLLVESLAVRRRVLGSEHKDVAVTLVELARVLKDLGRAQESEAPTREALAIRRNVFGEEHRETATSKSELALLLVERGDLDGAEQLFRESLATNERLLGRDHPNAGATKGNLARVLFAKGNPAAAEVLVREALDVNRQVFGATHVEYASTLNNLSNTVEAQGRLADAEAMVEEALRIARPQLTDEHPRVAVMMTNLARLQIAQGRGADAEPALRHVLDLRQRLLAAGDWRIAQAQSLLGAALLAQARYADAEPLMLAAEHGLKPVPGLQDRERVANRARLVTLYETWGRPQQASAYR